MDCVKLPLSVDRFPVQIVLQRIENLHFHEVTDANVVLLCVDQNLVVHFRIFAVDRVFLLQSADNNYGKSTGVKPNYFTVNTRDTLKPK